MERSAQVWLRAESLVNYVDIVKSFSTVNPYPEVK